MDIEKTLIDTTETIRRTERDFNFMQNLPDQTPSFISDYYSSLKSSNMSSFRKFDSPSLTVNKKNDKKIDIPLPEMEGSFQISKSFQTEEID